MRGERQSPSEVKRSEIIDYLDEFGEGVYIREFCRTYGFDYQELVRETLETTRAE